MAWRMRGERNFRRAVPTASCVGGALFIFASASAFGARAGADPPLPPVRPPSLPSEARPGGGTPSQPPVAAKTPQPTETAACLAELRTNEVEAENVPAPPAPVAGDASRVSACGIRQVAAVAGGRRGVRHAALAARHYRHGKHQARCRPWREDCPVA